MDALQNIAALLGLKALLFSILIFVPVERILALRPKQKIFRRGIANDAIYAIFNGPIADLLAGILFVRAISIAMLLVPVGVTLAVSGQPLWLQVLEIIVLTDLGVYATHRAFHAVPALWRFHSVHHGVEEMDWLAAFHNHPVDQVITKTISLLPVFLLGFSTEAIGIFSVIYVGHALLIHANIRISFGPLKYVVASPQFHHWHHANERHAYDKNFSGQLAVIDMIFGTFQVPSGPETPQKYGVDDPIPTNYFGQLGYPFYARKRQERGNAAVGTVYPLSDA